MNCTHAVGKAINRMTTIAISSCAANRATLQGKCWLIISEIVEAIATTAPAFICGVVEAAYHSFPVPSLLPPPSHHEHPHVPPSHWWNVKRQDWAGTTASLRWVDWVLFVFIWAMDGDPISIRFPLLFESTYHPKTLADRRNRRICLDPILQTEGSCGTPWLVRYTPQLDLLVKEPALTAVMTVRILVGPLKAHVTYWHSVKVLA